MIPTTSGWQSKILLLIIIFLLAIFPLADPNWIILGCGIVFESIGIAIVLMALRYDHKKLAYSVHFLFYFVFILSILFSILFSSIFTILMSFYFGMLLAEGVFIVVYNLLGKEFNWGKILE
jgi:hypothetical protein